MEQTVPAYILAEDPATNAAKLASLVGIDVAIDRLVAKHPNTSKKTLSKLASSKDKGVAHALLINTVSRGWYKQFQKYVLEYPWNVGRNINELKLFLSGSYPRWVKPAIVRNLPGEIVYGLAGNAGVSLDLLKILVECREGNEIYDNYYKYTGWDIDEALSRLACNPSLPSQFISKWAKELPEYDSLLDDFAENPNTSIALLKRLASNEEWRTRSGVAASRNIGKLPFKVLADMLGEFDPTGEVAESAVTNPDIPPNYLRRLVTGGYLSQLAWYDVASIPNAPASMLTWLSIYGGEQSEDILQMVAENPNTPPEIVERLFNEGHYACASQNPNLPVKILELCATNGDKDLRYVAARNPNTPPDLLESLSHDKGLSVDIAANPATPVSLLRKLATHGYEGVRWRVAGNISCPVGVLKRLAQDKYEYVRMCTANNINLPIPSFRTLAKDPSKRVRAVIARRVDTPKSILNNLANDPGSWTREIIASRKDIPKTILKKMACDKNVIVRCAVAGNPNISLSTLCSLIVDADKSVRGAVAENPGAAILFNAYDKQNQPIELEMLQRIVKNPRPSLARFIAFLQPDCPVESLEKYYRSPDWRERCAIAINPNTQPNIIEKLMKDGNRIVRFAAISRGEGK